MRLRHLVALATLVLCANIVGGPTSADGDPDPAESATREDRESAVDEPARTGRSLQEILNDINREATDEEIDAAVEATKRDSSVYDYYAGP